MTFESANEIGGADDHPSLGELSPDRLPTVVCIVIAQRQGETLDRSQEFEAPVDLVFQEGRLEIEESDPCLKLQRSGQPPPVGELHGEATIA